MYEGQTIGLAEGSGRTLEGCRTDGSSRQGEEPRQQGIGHGQTRRTCGLWNLFISVCHKKGKICFCVLDLGGVSSTFALTGKAASDGQTDGATDWAGLRKMDMDYGRAVSGVITVLGWHDGLRSTEWTDVQRECWFCIMCPDSRQPLFFIRIARGFLTSIFAARSVTGLVYSVARSAGMGF